MAEKNLGAEPRATVSLRESESRPTLLRRRRARPDRHSRKRVAFMHYGYYDVAFQYFTEHVLDADYVRMPAPTRRTLEIGSEHSNDYVCAPFKHILGDYVEALEAGANVLVQFTGYCRLTYYGELQEMILRDMGYDDFEMLNFSFVSGRPFKDYVAYCKKVVNPNLSVATGVANMLVLLRMVEHLDAYNDYHLANAGFEVEPRSFERAREAFFEDMRCCSTMADVDQAFRRGMDALRALPTSKPERPVCGAPHARGCDAMRLARPLARAKGTRPCRWAGNQRFPSRPHFRCAARPHGEWSSS